jgi:hypothetical protein
MAKRRGRQRGAQRHAEGEHGEKTREELIRELQSSPPEEPWGERPEDRLERPGAHRLEEGREQHDEADLNADKTRLSRKLDREKRDRSDYQVPGGEAHHPVAPDDD